MYTDIESTTLQEIEKISIKITANRIQREKDLKGKTGQPLFIRHKNREKNIVTFSLRLVKVYCFGYYDRFNFVIFEYDPCHPNTKTNIFWSLQPLCPRYFEPGNVVSLSFNICIIPELGNLNVCVINNHGIK
jgi:hypothetical protein